MGTLHIRRFALQLELRDIDDRDHYAYGCVVPYGEVTPFMEDGLLKRERFVFGALAAAARAWHRVVLYYGHDAILPNRLGYGARLEERSDGAFSTFKLDPTRYEQAREALNTTHKGLSLGFYSLRDRVAADGVTDRLHVRVDHVGAVPEPSYTRAELLALRGADPATLTDPALEVTEDEILAHGGSQAATTPRLDAALADLRRLQASAAERAVRADLEGRRS